jgi:hypothetical protein
MSGDLALAWETREPDRTRDLLAAVGFRAGPPGRMTIPGLVIVIVRTAGHDRLRPNPGGGQADASAGGPTGTRLLAAGIATVDLGRPEATFPPPVAALPDDDLLGARVVATGDARIHLLEPATEGRLAATLARHGEGPAALYLDVGPIALAAVRDRLVGLGERPRAGSGPFGPQLLASTRHPWGPHLLLVAADPAAAGPTGDAWATIEP